MAIQAHKLSKVFRTTRRQPGLKGTLRSLVAPKIVASPAVEDVTFRVARGELLALLGPNGAGKSTTIKMLTGILTPTSGQAIVNGVVPYKDRIRNARSIGAVFGQRTQLWWDLPARESFRILADIYSVELPEYRSRLRELDELLDLSSCWDTRVRHLSLGQRVRCDLAAAFLHDPAVVFLDEPTIGMDAVTKEHVRQLVRDQVERRHKTVLLTTHDMTEVERLASRVVLINRGLVVLDGTLADIRRQFSGGWRIHVTVAGPSALVQAGPPPDLALIRHEGSHLTFGPAEGQPRLSPHTAIRRVIEHYEVDDVRLEEADLEDVMRAAYRHGVVTAAPDLDLCR